MNRQKYGGLREEWAENLEILAEEYQIAWI